MPKKKMTNEEIKLHKEMQCDHDFAWAVAELLKGHSVRRNAWDGGSDWRIRWMGEFVILVPEQTLSPTPRDNSKDFLSPRGYHAHDSPHIWAGAHLIRGNERGVRDAWTPTMNDFMAKDWGPGWRDYNHLQEKLFETEERRYQNRIPK